jgi:pseudouridine synthase
MQLNRYLALCGVASRRKANDLIEQGRVRINGKIHRKKGCLIQEGEDIVELDSQRLTLPHTFRYILLNKPGGVITSMTDSRGRDTVIDLVDTEERVVPVGRLDYDTEGVLLLTNDGELTYRLTHPKFEVDKVYHAWVEGRVLSDAIDELSRGVVLNGGIRVRGEAQILREESERTLIEIRVHEGKKRQIKRMMKGVGHPVVELVRISFAGIRCDGLAKGKWRDLSESEIDHLYGSVGLTRSRDG